MEQDYGGFPFLISLNALGSVFHKESSTDFRFWDGPFSI